MIMYTIRLLLMTFFFLPLAHAAGGGGAVLDKVHTNMNDQRSLQAGAKLFVNYCLSCHSAQYARYNRVAEDLEIPLEALRENLMFTTDKVGDRMTTTMQPTDAQSWFGTTPPDLTLVARVRKPDWLYTYLRAFYRDETSPSGWNNSLFEKVAMPHAMYELQGVQRFVGKAEGESETLLDNSTAADGNPQYVVGDAIFELVHPGKLSPTEFDTAMTDLTAFLTYLAEPAQLTRKFVGVITLFSVLLLTLLCYVLKREYWRDVH